MRRRTRRHDVLLRPGHRGHRRGRAPGSDIDDARAGALPQLCADFELPDLILLCPCGSADVEVLAGREPEILSMEVS